MMRIVMIAFAKIEIGLDWCDFFLARKIKELVDALCYRSSRNTQNAVSRAILHENLIVCRSSN